MTAKNTALTDSAVRASVMHCGYLVVMVVLLFAYSDVLDHFRYVERSSLFCFHAQPVQLFSCIQWNTKMYCKLVFISFQRLHTFTWFSGHGGSSRQG